MLPYTRVERGNRSSNRPSGSQSGSVIQHQLPVNQEVRSLEGFQRRFTVAGGGRQPQNRAESEGIPEEEIVQAQAMEGEIPGGLSEGVGAGGHHLKGGGGGCGSRSHRLAVCVCAI